MVRFNSNFKSKRKAKNAHIEIVNKEFLPTRNEFETGIVEKQLKDANVKEVVFINESVKFSKESTDLKFTNFISDYKQQNQINAISRFGKNLSIVKDRPEEATSINYNERMLSILSLYDRENIKNIKGLMKTDIKGLFDVQEGLRVYWYYDLDDAEIKIICIDPQHLVLPSRHKGNGKKEMMVKRFESVINSKKHCISRYFSDD